MSILYNLIQSWTIVRSSVQSRVQSPGLYLPFRDAQLQPHTLASYVVPLASYVIRIASYILIALLLVYASASDALLQPCLYTFRLFPTPVSANAVKTTSREVSNQAIALFEPHPGVVLIIGTSSHTRVDILTQLVGCKCSGSG